MPQPLMVNNLDNTVNKPGLNTKAATSNVVYAHKIATTGVHGVGTGTIAKTSDITATKLDDLTAPDDNTDLNASSTKHGLLLKLENSGTKYLRDDGTWQTPTATVTETDPITGAIDGIVKANGYGTISAAVAGTDYSKLGYTLQAIAASQSTTTDSQTMYWGGFAVAPSTTANRWRIYIPKTGTIKAAYVNSYAGTAGTNESWSMYIRLNNTSDTLIQTLGANTNARLWSNTSLNIAVTAGNYIEMKEIQPAWATNPATVTRNAVIYIEG